MRTMFKAALVAAGVAAAVVTSTASANAASPASTAQTASPAYTRVGCFGPYIIWPVKISRAGTQDQCFQFTGGETLNVQDHYDSVWSGSYRITVYYQGQQPHSLDPEQGFSLKNGFLQSITVIGAE
ncbi:MAG TPA: hypothetical protein VGN81_41630 [Pseudonocardiaceae bacterium]|jgi:hypothetical protein